MTAVAEEDVVRAQLYRLLARLLSAPPDADTLRIVAAMAGDATSLGTHIGALAKLVARVTPRAISYEYHDLFVGPGRGELVPFASCYLTGFLHDKPLARLRGDMAELGIERDPAVSGPEDHIGALMDMMAGLILGEFDEPASLDVQRRFFRAHVASWAPHFFRDLEQCRSSVFYAPVGGMGHVFMEIEEVAFSME